MSFASLPAELQFLIISESLRDEADDRSSLACFAVQCGDCDLSTGLALAQVSRSCYAIITSLLYTHIRVTTPSALRQIHSTLKARPDLAEQIKSIHLGPDSELPSSGWPLSVADEEVEWPDILISTTLSECDEEDGRLPRWCEPHSSFSIEHSDMTCPGNAVHQALEQALEELDIEPWRRYYGREGTKCGVRAWASRLFMLQAVLDLVLIEMRRHEDASSYRIITWRDAQSVWLSTPPAARKDCREGYCGHYPWFALLNYHSSKDRDPTSSSTAEDDDMFWIYSWQIWEHIVRPGGIGDHFDHLVRFVQSTRKALDLTELEWAAVKNALAGPHHHLFHEEDWLSVMGTPEELAQFYGYYDDQSEEEENEDDEDDDAASSASSASMEWSNEDIDHVADKAEDLIELGRSLLALTVNIINLSVTSYFHRSLSGLKAPEKLRWLSIGPKSRYWKAVFPAGLAAKLVGLEDLRVCGMMTQDDADKIAWGMPKLETMIWEITENQGALALSKLIECLQAPQDRAPKPTAVKRKRTKGNGKVRQQQQQQQPSQRYTEVRVHPDDAAWALSSRYSTETNRTWTDGGRAPGTLHAVKVLQRPNFAIKSVYGRRWKDESELLAEQYEDGREWWEEGTVGVN